MGKFVQDAEVTPLLYRRISWDF